MDLSVQYLSFFVIQPEGKEGLETRKFKHYQTLTGEDYAQSEIRHFLEGEFKRICKRKVEKHPNTEAAPTKIGTFIVEPGHDLSSNPNYNLFQRLRAAGSKQDFISSSDEMIRVYMDTSAVRGGAFIISSVKLNAYFDEPLIFLMKCDFEPKIARIADERNLIAQVEMAISARNIKWIQYPHMPEEGMLEPWELKIHQASHARYFEDFLKFVSYEKSVPEIVSDRVMTMVQEYMEQKWQDHDGEGRQQEEQSLEQWAASDKRELQQKWTHEQVVNAASVMVEHKPDLQLSFKLDDIAVKGLMADYGSKIHIARHNGRYIVLLEGDSVHFEKSVSPVELLHPNELHEVIERLKAKAEEEDTAPWD